jgi:Amidohydrolase family
MEHLHGILAGSSTEEAQITEAWPKVWETLTAGDSTAHRQMRYKIHQLRLETQNDELANALFTKFVENESWQVPTLVTLRGHTIMNDPAFTNDSRMKYLHKSMRAFWNPSTNRFMKMKNEADWLQGQRIYARQLEMVGMMAKASVPLLAGTDTPNPYSFPGFGLHDELELMVEAGLSILAALQTATLNPARFLGATDSLGTVEADKLADLVILDSNPLEDIRNSSAIFAVISNGQYLGRNYLDSVLVEIEKDNN